MVIDLLSPFWGGLAVGIILLNIAGILKFAIISTQKKAAEDHISNLISEIYSLHKNYKNEISEIKERNTKEFTDALADIFNHFDKRLDIILKQYTPNFSNQNIPPTHENLLVSAMKNNKE